MSLSLLQLLCVTGLGMFPSHRASLHAPENTRLLWFSSHLIETGLSMRSGWVSRWIFMGDLVGSVHVVLSGVYSIMMLGSLLQNTKTLLRVRVCVVATHSLLNTCEAKVFRDESSDLHAICGYFSFWENALFLCQIVLAAPGVLSFPSELHRVVDMFKYTGNEARSELCLSGLEVGNFCPKKQTLL